MAVVSGKRTAIAAPSLRPAGGGKPMLVVIAGPELGRQIDLEKGELDIGRDEGAVLCIDSDLVSRRHASIQRFAGRFIVADLGSTNGTFVNDEKIRTHTLSDGDQIRVGKVVLKYTECAIEVQYHEEIAQRANVDALTGTYNKRYFQEASAKAFVAARAGSRPLSFIVFDIDHFKKINDTHGHAAGDHVLREVARVVREQLRPSDAFCRVGGEEFAVVLEGTPLPAATSAAEFIRGGIEMTDFVFEGTRIPVTVSLGVATLDPSDAGAESLFKRADERLYAAKRSGRNQVC